MNMEEVRKCEVSGKKRTFNSTVRSSGKLELPVAKLPLVSVATLPAAALPAAALPTATLSCRITPRCS